jgi:hypothetical protein
MSTLAPIADKLGKLVRMLTSDHDGEVVAAARSINRVELFSFWDNCTLVYPANCRLDAGRSAAA